MARAKKRATKRKANVDRAVPANAVSAKSQVRLESVLRELAPRVPAVFDRSQLEARLRSMAPHSPL
jgi:hypothetical protein